MDIQQAITAHIALSRKETLSKSDQLTLGEMILKLEPIMKKQNDRDSEATVVFDFGYFAPTDIGSWRGAYEELALNYVEGESLTVTHFYNLLKNSIGKTFDGYKGGEFKMSKHTPVWVANYGRSNNTAVIDIWDNEYQIIIVTGYRNY